jgi:hypothetical protein
MGNKNIKQKLACLPLTLQDMHVCSHDDSEKENKGKCLSDNSITHHVDFSKDFFRLRFPRLALSFDARQKFPHTRTLSHTYLLKDT